MVQYTWRMASQPEISVSLLEREYSAQNHVDEGSTFHIHNQAYVSSMDSLQYRHTLGSTVHSPSRKPAYHPAMVMPRGQLRSTRTSSYSQGSR